METLKPWGNIEDGNTLLILILENCGEYLKQMYLDSKKAAVSKKIQVKYLVLTIFQEIIDNVAKGAKKEIIKNGRISE